MPKPQGTADIEQLFFDLQLGSERQVSQPLAGTGQVFQPQGVGNALPQHLKAAADTDKLAAIAQMAGYALIPALLADKSQVGAHILAAGQQQEIQPWKFALMGRPYIIKLDIRMQPQRVKVGMVADPGVHQDADSQSRPSLSCFRLSSC